MDKNILPEANMASVKRFHPDEQTTVLI